MLKLFQSIFGGEAKPGSAWPESLVEAVIERALDGTDPRLRALGGGQQLEVARGQLLLRLHGLEVADVVLDVAAELRAGHHVERSLGALVLAGPELAHGVLRGDGVRVRVDEVELERGETLLLVGGGRLAALADLGLQRREIGVRLLKRAVGLVVLHAVDREEALLLGLLDEEGVAADLVRVVGNT